MSLKKRKIRLKFVRFIIGRKRERVQDLIDAIGSDLCKKPQQYEDNTDQTLD